MEGPPSPTPSETTIKQYVKDYLEADDRIKNTNKSLKGTRDTKIWTRTQITKYMDATNTERINLGSAGFLECVQKKIKTRPTTKQMQDKLDELLRNGVRDPERLIMAMMSCAGTKTELRLLRKKISGSKKTKAAAQALVRKALIPKPTK